MPTLTPTPRIATGVPAPDRAPLYGDLVRLDVDPSLEPATYPFSHSIRVRFAETDAMGIVHHSRYLLYFEEARVAYLRHLGRPYSEMRKDGIEHAVLETFVQYRRPLRFDEVMDVHVVLAKVTRASFQLAYLVTSTATSERPG